MFSIPLQFAVGLAVVFASCSIRADATRGEAKAQLCLACHKAAYPWTPLLEGQPAAYLAKSMADFKEGTRQEAAMNTNMAALTKQDMQDIADYFAAKPLPASAQGADPGIVQAGRNLADQMNCASCHQSSYKGTAEVPRLAGQKQKYLQSQFDAFSSLRRKGHPGSPLPKEPQHMQALSHFLASLE
jgi:cytochrome c553